ncbi:MAG: D-alanyl-D-alanine carboxypeptidase/D-alanyl-D-alanine-endopeptidase [Corynebacterium sp.]|uniref:D-alanyl-D-alanine carboxypeptidase/D-alanyl-D-alanine endopeptidase n=1 Tax=Corynebacterium sp. TaxID=1720 RepID=UPI0026DD7A15|nr:D-alanyl-D-alanine carboxypeptidase/D-alanyl-D-alanine-endopeptidase [Corynebacterium sp.]MDO5097409.1 D-alanyl-D-alanine carboxypeptidase/D-alanyl-D-alanine-endopeptidase [Corynebacterium sp.]
MKNAKWWVATAAATVTVVATVTAGVVVTQVNQLYYDPAPPLVDAPQPFKPLTPTRDVSLAGLQPLLDDARLGRASIDIRDLATGEVVLARDPQAALLPASTTKTLTAAAALLTLDPADRITTVVKQQGEDTAVIMAAGDVWMTEKTIGDLAHQISTKLPNVKQVLIDTSAWSAPNFLETWERLDIDGGFVAPLEPAMIHGGRLGGDSGDLPRSHAPALDVAKAVATELGVPTYGYTTFAGDKEAAPTLATVQSPPLRDRLEAMMEESDNVMAEAIGRELSGSDPAGETMRILAEHFTIADDIVVKDNSGLSTENRISAELLNSIITAASTDKKLAPLFTTLPVAGGSGTLIDRYLDKPGRGYVRAKTGTLTDTAALTGTIAAESGHTYSFTIICNNAPVLPARAAMDELTSAIRTAT